MSKKTSVPLLPIQLQGPPISSADEYLTKAFSTPTPASTESRLLQSIRTALRGSDTEHVSNIQKALFTGSKDAIEREVTWNAHCVVVSYGGVMIKKWDLRQEGQSIQWACLGEIEQAATKELFSVHGSANYTSDDHVPAERHGAKDRPTFGPFTRAQVNPKPDPGKSLLVPAVFIFLRSIGMIFLLDGLQYTFSLPFIVRKAWPVSPHGVMIQRVLEPGEVQEAETTGDALLPTIFSVTSPFAEPSAVGFSTGIVGGNNGTSATLQDEDEHLSSPLKSIPPTEMVVWASYDTSSNKDNIVITVDVEKRELSVWRYVYIKPKDTPAPLGRRSRSNAKKRQSWSGIGSRRTSALYPDPSIRTELSHPLSPKVRSRDPSPTPDFFDRPEMPPLSSLPGMPPALSTTAAMQSLVTGTTSSQWPHASAQHTKGRRSSLNRNDLSFNLDRGALGNRVDVDITLAPIEHGRMKAAYWMEKIYVEKISAPDASSWRKISVSLFDTRWDGTRDRSLMAITFPGDESVAIFSLYYGDDKKMKVGPEPSFPGISATSVCATRGSFRDLLLIKPDGRLSLLVHGICEVPVVLKEALSHGMRPQNVDSRHSRVVCVEESHSSTVTLAYEDGRRAVASFDLSPTDQLTKDCLQALSAVLPGSIMFPLHMLFLEYWSKHNFSTADVTEFECFRRALYTQFELGNTKPPNPSDPWSKLGQSQSHANFRDDPALRNLKLPPNTIPRKPIPSSSQPSMMIAPVLYTLHTLGEYLRLQVSRFNSVLLLAPIICRLAIAVRPEWADYWKRLVPDTMDTWPSTDTTVITNIDDRLPVWPPDISAILYGRISTPDWKVPWHDTQHIAARFYLSPSYVFGGTAPLKALHELTLLYQNLSDSKADTLKKAQNAIYNMVSRCDVRFLDSLPLGIAAPLREAARTCQLSPPGNWPLEAYKAIGRNDLAASASDSHDIFFRDGYRSIKDYLNPSHSRRTIGEVVADAKVAANGDLDTISGVELNLEDFTDIRFGQDRRLEEVARMLCSSNVPAVRIMERPELNEHDQTRDNQNQVLRVAERTLAQPYGRALFTFGSTPTITREAYNIPKLELAVRIMPLNITVVPEPGKLPVESLSWGEFHNGVAAGLRLSPTAKGVESSWIAFNKPSDLTPEHAGFLLGLGLTGHLKEMLTWHTFSYLTPKHDLTSIAVLLGLSAANVGSGNQHVTKLLAVHTPALLPTPAVDLNVSLPTQAAGLSGVGLLYLGTKNRRMAEVCLNQISRRDLVQPDLSNEHREAYTYAAALAFGMIMLGKGTTIPADVTLLSRLSVLVHGDANLVLGNPSRSQFDINLTSPAATIALGLMYLRTERPDIADILTIPDTVVSLNRIQPSFLLVRTIARSLIMWNSIAPTNEWLVTQIPASIREAIDLRRQKSIDDSMELAYYNILAGCCFVVGLKFAGTASQEAYIMIVRYFDLFTRLVYSNGPAFDHKIKRSAVRDGLNIISISLSMVMAGTGEISCLRRLRYSYGMYQQAMYLHGFKYGVHVATYQAMGLLFLGGGRFTLGTSDAAIACLVTSFFPRSHHISSDNKSFLQALRHLWVLAVEPRCLIARDVDTSEVVYLPVKITVREDKQESDTQLISPTLIPDIGKITRVRVDTPRYWPFYLDTEALPRHKEALLRSQTLYVKRRTAFLSYTEDPRGSRSLFVRSGSSAGDAATLDFPQLKDAKTHPASDLSEFITSFSNDVLFLAFADHFARDVGETEAEQLFHTYCHAALLDSILQDKPQTLQTHLTLYLYRSMKPTSRFFHLRLQDLRFAADFYSKIYEKRFSGKPESAPRPPLIRDSTVRLCAVLSHYAKGQATFPPGDGNEDKRNMDHHLAWYLLRNGVPVSTLLVILHRLATEAHNQCLRVATPGGTTDANLLDEGIREVLHATGTKMTTAFGSGWSVRSVDEVVKAWSNVA
ncbi:hypothetical protein BDQ17DRAFT_1372131 [Cyathus striatus]|nr:hypothetical protein BDQ17DRAFT_1372131 [Cyathus striatus]